MRQVVSFLGVLAMVVALDLGVKHLAAETLMLYRPVEVMGEWFRLRLTYNRGIAFGFFATDGPGVLIASGLATVLLAGWFIYALRTEHYPLPAPWALGLLLGGAVANFADRFVDGKVTDFLDFGLGPRRFATFNLADVFIFTGVALLLWASHVRPQAREPSAEGISADRMPENK